MKNFVRFVGCIAISIMLCGGAAQAATMNEYCITPPFIQTSILPNLLLLIDNSASMYDLAYADTGRKSCSTSTATYCTSDVGCPSGQTCSNFTRQPYYCYDQTFSSAKTYSGYFDSSKLYKYDFVAKEFIEDSTAFSCTAGAGETAKSINEQLCVIYTAANLTNTFKASGNYLNWLTASKFDVQKKILTGGKYDGTDLLSESRGCVGQSFIKEANTANFVNYNTPETNNTNTALGITFGIRGPFDAVNEAAPSPGGQTYLDIFKGNYDQGKCQAAMTAIVSGGNADIKQKVDECLASTTETTAVTKTKVAFQQSMQACWQRREGHAIGGDDINTVKNQCTEIYSEFATCSNDPKKICTTDTVVAACGAGNTCNYGPPAIVPGSAALLCGNQYEGQYYYYQGAGVAGTCTKDGAACTVDGDCTPATYAMCKNTSVVCTSNADCPGSGNSCVDSPASKLFANTCSTSATTAGWMLRPGTTEEMMIATHNQFCSDMSATPVIDPTDAPSDTSQYDNVPAILSGVGVEAQLSQPIGTLTVKLKKTTAPTGVISDFSSQVRLGAMTFNFAGSAAEATAGTLPAPRLCSNDSTKVCTLNIDCISPGTCDATISGISNFDGGKIIHYIGTGHCSATTATVCYNDAGCPSGETCKSDGVGTYTGGLVKAVNDVKANAWTPFAEAFYSAIGYFAKTAFGTSRTDLRLNTTDFDENRNPSQYRCQTNNILLISDGMSTADRNSNVDNLATLYTAAGGSTSWTTGAGGCPSYAGSVNLDNMAWIGRNLNIRTFNTGTASAAVALADKERNEFITSYVVFNGDSNGQAGECDSKTLLSQTATKGGTTLYQAVDPAALDTALRDAFRAVASGLSSGTAASILNNSEGSGANLLQAVFYPKKTFDSATEANWIGEIQNLWYYLDPGLQKTSIREDSTQDFTLNLRNDKVAAFYFDPLDLTTKVKLFSDANGDGSADNPSVPDAVISPDEVHSIWKAGRMLWERDLATSPRTIYTGYNSTSGNEPQLFSGLVINSDFQDVLQIPANADASIRNTAATALINYIHGVDQAGMRGRKVTILGCGLLNCNREWKLGDIVSSTPKLISNVKLNSYSLSPPTGYGDNTYAQFTNSTTYRNRGMVFVGGNDGMLHAFKLGILKELSDRYAKAKMVDSSGATATAADLLGKEEWAFIPKNAVPYLNYLADPTYSHLYYVDKSSSTLDASIGVNNAACSADYSQCIKDASTWRTVLVGGMGLGGAVKATTDGCTAPNNCVKTPIADHGYSSYFALDVTDPAAPKFLWEFSPPGLGYSTTGPALVRIATKNAAGDGPDHNKNGKWFAVFASGPTGPIDTDLHEFKGQSDQELKIFIVDLATGTPVKTINTGVTNAFAGSLASSWIDTDRANRSSLGYYSDDAVYIGYVKKDTDTNTWTKGGVGRLLTRESPNPESADESKQWVWSTLIDDIGPVTTSVSKLQDRRNNKLWIYFGTGRYFYKTDDNAPASRNVLYGVKEPCYYTATNPTNDLDQSCTASVPSGLIDQSGDTPSSTIAENAPGWFINLDAPDSNYFSERMITDPIASPAGAVFFTTFKPSADLCKFGGDSYIWAANYASGGRPPAAAIQGRALMQVSTGAFAEINLSTALTDKGNRKTHNPITGVPPTAQGLSLISNPPPVKKFLHVKEK